MDVTSPYLKRMHILKCLSKFPIGLVKDDWKDASKDFPGGMSSEEFADALAQLLKDGLVLKFRDDANYTKYMMSSLGRYALFSHPAIPLSHHDISEDFLMKQSILSEMRMRAILTLLKYSENGLTPEMIGPQVDSMCGTMQTSQERDYLLNCLLARDWISVLPGILSKPTYKITGIGIQALSSLNEISCAAQEDVKGVVKPIKTKSQGIMEASASPSSSPSTAKKKGKRK